MTRALRTPGPTGRARGGLVLASAFLSEPRMRARAAAGRTAAPLPGMR